MSAPPLPTPTGRDVQAELLVVADCPNAAPAAELFADVLAHEGLGHLDVRVEVVGDQERAEARGFLGSPSFLIDDVDLFAVPGAPAAVACRVYRTGARLSGLPDRAALAAAVRARRG